MVMKSPSGPAAKPSSAAATVTTSVRMAVGPLGAARPVRAPLTRTETAGARNSSPRAQILRENLRQPERGDDRRVDEARDLGDPPTVDPQRVHRAEPQDPVPAVLVARQAGAGR